MLNRTNIVLLLIGVLCFTLAACATPAETTAGVVATIGAAGAFIHELSPLLSPEMQAKLSATATQIDGTAQATQQAVGIIADAIAAFKTNVATQMAGAHDSLATLGDRVATGLADTAAKVAAMPSREEVYLVGGGAASVGTAASRGLSAVKHGKAAKLA